jgi:hypothetical protein
LREINPHGSAWDSLFRQTVEGLANVFDIAGKKFVSIGTRLFPSHVAKDGSESTPDAYG